MKKIIPIVSIIIIINLIFGYLYQVSNEVICFTELGLLGIGGLLFWISFYKPLKRFTISLIEKGGLQISNLSKFGGLGIIVVILNLFFCQLFLIITMYSLFGCESPSFQILNASMTNSLTGNILCYSLLIFSFINEHDPIFQNKIIEKKEQVPLLKKADVIAPSTELVTSKKDYFLLSDSKKVNIKVYISTISHIVVQTNCIFIHSENRKFVKYQSLKSILQELPSHQFIRIHRSTVINIDFIESMTNHSSGDGEVYLKEGVQLRYSRNYKKALQPFLS